MMIPSIPSLHVNILGYCDIPSDDDTFFTK